MNHLKIEKFKSNFQIEMKGHFGRFGIFEKINVCFFLVLVHFLSKI